MYLTKDTARSRGEVQQAYHLPGNLLLPRKNTSKEKSVAMTAAAISGEEKKDCALEEVEVAEEKRP